MSKYYLKFPHGIIEVNDYLGINPKLILSFLPMIFDISDEYDETNSVILRLKFVEEVIPNVNCVYEDVLIHGGSHPEYAKTYSSPNGEIHYSFDDGLYLIWNRKSATCTCYFKNRQSKYLRFFIKEFVFEYLYSLGYFTLHAASFKYGDKAYVIAGDKGAGKTTLLLALYELDNKVELISNDRLLIRKVENTYYVLSADTNIRATPHTLDLVEFYCNFGVEKYFEQVEKRDKKYAALRSFERIETNSTELAAIVVCDSTNKSFIRNIQHAPLGTVLQDREEHPRWIGIDDSQSLLSEEQFLQEQFKCISYVRNSTIKDNVKKLIEIIQENT